MTEPGRSRMGEPFGRAANLRVRGRQRKGCGMSKVAFCFPGQGSLEAGMGREIAEAVPAAMDVYDVGSAASGLDLQKLCFDSPFEDLVETEVQQPALVATCLAILAALREHGIEPDAVVGHSVGRVRGARVGRSARHRRGDRARPRAWARDGRGGPPASRLDGRDPRARGRGGRDSLSQDRGRVAGELQLPRADRDLGRERGRRGVVRRGREPRRSTSDQAEGLGCVPQPARRAGGGSAQARGRRDSLPRSDRAVHVDRDREGRACAPASPRCSSTS